jgi:uncharacterized protein YjbJ (UPF0337 family)
VRQRTELLCAFTYGGCGFPEAADSIFPESAYNNGAHTMKNVPTPTNNNSNIPPKPIQANKTQDTDFNVQKKPQAKDAAPQSTDKKSLEDMDSNSAQKVKNGSNGNMNGNTNTDAMSDDQWKSKIGSAKQQWSKLEQEELVACCGNSDQLSTLIQKRYSTNKADADKQVKEFFNKH